MLGLIIAMSVAAPLPETFPVGTWEVVYPGWGSNPTLRATYVFHRDGTVSAWWDHEGVGDPWKGTWGTYTGSDRGWQDSIRADIPGGMGTLFQRTDHGKCRVLVCPDAPPATARKR